MSEVTFTEQNFDDEVLHSKKPVLVDFFAEWCGPCKMMAPIVDELAKELEADWKIGKCNVDDAPSLAEKYNVRSIPTLVFLKDGKEVHRLLGFQSKEALSKNLAELS